MKGRDFLNEDQDQSSIGSSSSQNMNGRDFLNEDQETYNGKESFVKSLAYAPFRIGKDLANKVYQGIQAIPGYYEKAKTEVPGLLETPNLVSSGSEMYHHPAHAIGQGIAGINEGINQIAQFPLEASQYGTNRLNLIPQSITNFIQKMTPEDTSQAINQLFGSPKYAGEAALRGITRNLLPISGTAKALELMPHLTKYGASRALSDAKKLSESRNIDPLNIDPNLIEDTRQFLPNTKPNRNMIDAAKSGNYNALFNLQSDLGKNASDYAKSLFSAAERTHGRAGLQTRNELLDSIHENLQEQGHHDISDLLNKGQIDYRRYLKFRPYRNALALAGIGLAIPKNPIIDLSKKVLFHNNQ